MKDTNFFYDTAFGHMLMKGMNRIRGWDAVARFLCTPASRCMIPSYIRRNHIDMSAFPPERYRSFAEFFARKKDVDIDASVGGVLISPSDGLLSVYSIRDGVELPIKGFRYHLCDLVSDAEAAGLFRDGLCLIFRLQASDYHRFCCFDDLRRAEPHFVPGQLHSVQPAACSKVPVYRLNRRWWSLLDTAHFGPAAQIEVGAMMVGGVRYTALGQWLGKGEEMGSFELAGSTIVLLLTADVRKKLELFAPYRAVVDREEEIPVKIGDWIGKLRDEIITE